MKKQQKAHSFALMEGWVNIDEEKIMKGLLETNTTSLTISRKIVTDFPSNDPAIGAYARIISNYTGCDADNSIPYIY